MRARYNATLAIGLLITVCSSGCGVSDDPQITEEEDAISVATTIDQSCSTASVLGLSKQIAREVACISPFGTLSHFDAGNGVVFASNAVLPYLSASAKADLHRAAHEGGRVFVTSGYRTVAQQYLLYRWYRQGRCGIAIAATPGTSNHEGARAVDLSNWASRIGAMADHHWAHDVPGDAVHFDHLSSPDIRGRDVRAFQRLWNKNHPHDKIAVDGVFGHATAVRLRHSPAKGFAKGATCEVHKKLAELVAVSGPDRVMPGSFVHYDLALENNDDQDWPAGSRIVVAGAIADEGPLDLGVLRDSIGAGTTGELAIDFRAPRDEQVLELPVWIVDGQRVLAEFELAVTVSAERPLESDELDEDAQPVDADDDGVTS